jgi:tetratricopeptide (TPR) repeat protein
VVLHFKFLICFLPILLFSNINYPYLHAEILLTTKSEDALKNYNLGLDLLARMHYQDALKKFENAISIDKEFAMSYLQMAFIFYNEENYNSYIENVNKAVLLSSKVSEGERLIILSEKAKMNHNSDEMKKLIKQLIEKFPGDKLSYYYLGNYYFSQGNYASAIKEFENAQTIAPDYIPVLNLLIYSNAYMGKYFKSEELMNTVAKLIPDEPLPFYIMGDIYFKQGKYAESNESYKKALEKNPDFITAYLGLGNNLVFQDKHNEARSEFEKACNILKDESLKRNLILSEVCSYLHEGNFELAYGKLQDRYNNSERSNDILQMVSDLNLMGDILLEWGKSDEARLKYRKSVELCEKSALPKEIREDIKHQSLFFEARLDIKKNNISSAKQKAEKFNNEIQKNNNIVDIRSYHELLGLIALQEKKYDDAINEFKLSDQRDPCVLCKSAEAYFQKGDIEMAKDLWTKVISFNENNIHFAFVKDIAVKNLAQIGK